MKIGILQCGHAMGPLAANHGDFTDMFQRLLAGNGFDFLTFDVVDMQFPAGTGAADGWLLTGSRYGSYENHDFIVPLEDFIRTAYRDAVPMVGICFGHQIIAQALGGAVEKFNGGWSLGRQSYDYDGLGPVALNAWHQDQVVQRPTGAQAIARNEFCENAALLYGDRALTIQPHPEFSNAAIEDLIQLRRGSGDYPDDLMELAQQETENPTAGFMMAEQIAKFFIQPRNGTDD